MYHPRLGCNFALLLHHVCVGYVGSGPISRMWDVIWYTECSAHEFVDRW